MKYRVRWTFQSGLNFFKDFECLFEALMHSLKQAKDLSGLVTVELEIDESAMRKEMDRRRRERMQVVK